MAYIKVLGDHWAQALWTERADGDFGRGAPSEQLQLRRASVVSNVPEPGRWSLPFQVHGSDVAVATGGEAEVGEADAVVTAGPGVVVSVLSADCATVAMASPEGVVGAVHCGWRGLVAGVVPAAAASIRKLGGSELVAVVGPCIHPCCCEFSAADLDLVVSKVGARARAKSRRWLPSLDIPGSLEVQLEEAGVVVAEVSEQCTRCDDRFFSYRRDATTQRQALAVWRGPGAGPGEPN